jgi:hypothetical protein
MSKTFGAPFGASTPLGKSGVDSLTVRAILPANGCSGFGKASSAPVVRVTQAQSESVSATNWLFLFILVPPLIVVSLGGKLLQ